jgi:hypothetical protein
MIRAAARRAMSAHRVRSFPGEAMKFLVPRRACATLLAALVTGAASAAEWRPFVSVTPLYQGKGDIDGGGDYSAWGAIVRAGVAADLGRGNRAGVTFNYDYTDYSFSNPASFGGVAPWNVVQRYGVGVPLSFALRDDWTLGVTPSFDWFRENGADSGESFTWGATVSATKRFADGNRLGLGVGVFDRIEKTTVFPFLVVDVRLTDRWRLINPLPAGPTGPAGLELDYRFDSGWNLGLGAAWRSTRFRLSESGPVPNGVGEERGIPVFFRATRSLGERTALNLYAGVVAGGQLTVEDPSGNELRKVDFDPAPLLGATFSTRF